MSIDLKPTSQQQSRGTWRQWSKLARVRIGCVLMLIVALSLFSWWWPRRGTVAVVSVGGWVGAGDLQSELKKYSRRLPIPMAKIVQPWLASHGGWVGIDEQVTSADLTRVRSSQFDPGWLRRFPRLQSVSIHGRLVGPKMRDLAGLTKLTSVTVEKLPATGDLGELRHLPNLRSLRIMLHTASGGGLDRLPLLPNLRVVQFSVQPSAEAIRSVGQCSNLEIVLLGSGVTDDDHLRFLAGMTKLHAIHAHGGNPIGVAGLSHLARITSLIRLDIFSTSATDDEIQVLASLSNLTFLTVHGPKLTQPGIDRLKSAMPGCRIDDRKRR